MNKRILAALASTALAFTMAGPAAAQQAGAARACDRACLIDLGEQYLKALVAHDPSRAPISPQARYTENGVELLMPDGLWRIASGVGSYRLHVADPQNGALGFFATMEENGAPIILATRLKVRDRMITEIETTISRRDATISAGAGAGVSGRAEDLRPRPQFTQVIPPAERRTREQMINIANGYFSALENNDGIEDVPQIADDCVRIENGFQTSGRPLADPSAKPSNANLPCSESIALGYYREDTRLRDRRFSAIDEERGLIYTHVYFDHDAVLRSYKLRNGETVTVKRTAPWTWMIQEAFQIRNGKISQVEAVLLSVPYGMRPGWDTGSRMPSIPEEIERARAY
jgi:hypothetical protein